ncbi:MAG: class I SAM-dependent methyltransferase [Polyangiaceae bacterium]
MYTRDQPSPEYREMVEMYSMLHQEGAESERKKDDKRSATQTFSGKMLMEQAATNAELISRTGSQSLLDYGCGKGEAYEAKDIELAGGERAASLTDYWQIDELRRYDPGYEPFSQLPTASFDAVLCIDVLEHITEPDLPWVLNELFGYAQKFVFANIACYPAKKHLPNGQNAHCTVRSPEWWTGMIHAVAMRHTAVSYRFHLATRTGPRKKLGGLYGKRTLEHQSIERWARLT